MVSNMIEDVTGRNGSIMMNSPSKELLSPIPCLDGVAVTPASNNAGGSPSAEKECNKSIKDAIDELKDELEAEQVDDDIADDRLEMKSPPQKDAFELVDEFINDVEEPRGVNGSTDPPIISDITDVQCDDTETDHIDTNGAVNPLELEDSSEANMLEKPATECDDSESAHDSIVDSTEVFEDCALNEEQQTNESNTEDIDPLMEEDQSLEQKEDVSADAKPGKRKASADADDDTTVRKSSRLRTKAESQAILERKPKEKQKMLQKPTERPSQVEEEESELSDSETAENQEENLDSHNTEGGDPSKEPGVDSSRRIDQDLLLPFRYGWTRECVFREVKNGPTQVDIFYWPPKDGIDYGSRNREARRKRRSKVDQERYFEEFKHKVLSVNNFSYVRRALGLNNEAFEMIRHAKPGLETRSDKNRRASKKVATYKEVAEHEGLLSSSQSEGEDSEAGIEEITEFDIGLPLTLQVYSKVTPLREEHKKRRKWPDRERCITPPLASDIAWTFLDDDPLGVYTELHNELEEMKAPPTPPPLRALRLTSHSTTNSIAEKYKTIREGLPDPLDRVSLGNKDLAGSENLASHDLAVRKFKNYRPPQTHVSNRPQIKSGIPASKRPSHIPQKALQSPSRPPGSPAQGFVKVRLPMPSTNGKRPVVELVMLTNGKYQPIKFTNNRQVTESIPKRLFEQANLMKKTLYQRSVQVPKIGTKQVFLAINPTPGGVRPFGGSQQQSPKPVQQTSDQVSILVRPAGGGNAVLLNVPRSVALKVKVGTTLSFSASNDQKYTVLDNKMHPPVGRNKPPNPTRQVPPPGLPSLPSGVSIRAVPSGTLQGRPGPVATGRPISTVNKKVQRPPVQIRPRPIVPPPTRPSQNREIFHFTPCSPFCPGVTGIPELECTTCHSLFHPKCVNIEQWQIASIQSSFKCKRCASSSNRTEVIDLD